MWVVLFSLTASKCLHLICLHFLLQWQEMKVLPQLAFQVICTTYAWLWLTKSIKKAGEMQEMIKIIIKKRIHHRTLNDREAILKQTSIWPSCKTYLRDSWPPCCDSKRNLKKVRVSCILFKTHGQAIKSPRSHGHIFIPWRWMHYKNA